MPRKNKGLTANGEKKEPKIDSKTNHINIDIQQLKAAERHKVPLRIDERTVILVLPENCNDEYRTQYLENKSRSENMIMEQVGKNRNKKV